MTTPNSDEINGQPQPTTPAPPAKRAHRLQQRHQAAALQRVAFDAVMALKETSTNTETGKLTVDDKTAAAIARLIAAWDTAANRLRILRGRGLPSVVKSKPSRSRSSAPPPEPLAD